MNTNKRQSRWTETLEQIGGAMPKAQGKTQPQTPPPSNNFQLYLVFPSKNDGNDDNGDNTFIGYIGTRSQWANAGVGIIDNFAVPVNVAQIAHLLR